MSESILLLLLMMVGAIAGWGMGYWHGYWNMHRNAQVIEKSYIAENKRLREELTKARTDLSGLEGAMETVQEMIMGEDI